VQVGPVGKSGFLADSPQFSVMTQNVVLPEGKWLRFGLMFGDDLLYTLDGTTQATALAESFGDRCDPLFETVDYAYGPTRYEGEHNLVSYDNFSLMRSRLRGFGWLTIIPKQIASTFGGHDALVHSTFSRVTELKGVDATPRPRRTGLAAGLTKHRGIGVWRYVDRAVDEHGQIIDVLVSKRRDGDAARCFFQRALSTLKVMPTEVVTDAAPVYPRVLHELVPPRGITSSNMPTTGSRPTTAGSNTGCDPCAAYVPIATAK
jgi:DDE domain